MIEIYGEYWHTQAFVREKKGGREYDWNPEKMIEEYAKVGIDAVVLWERGDLANRTKVAKTVAQLKHWLEQSPLPSGRAPVIAVPAVGLAMPVRVER